MSTFPASFVTAFTPNALIPKWWRTDFQVAGQSGFTGGISLTSATFQPVPSCMRAHPEPLPRVVYSPANSMICRPRSRKPCFV